ncbi:MAG: hypothetical protein IJU41_03640 [Clostridia bacterium]|nr:hypothetical protein [Clostridia bacterium]
MQKYIIIDGTEYTGIRIITIKRSFSVTDGDNAGRLAVSGQMVRDIIGTFYNYQFTVDPKASDPATYDAFYEVISAPVDSHVIVVPYGQSTLTFDAYVTSGDDELILIDNDANRWKNLSFSAIAMAPQRLPAND